MENKSCLPLKNISRCIGFDTFSAGQFADTRCRMQQFKDAEGGFDGGDGQVGVVGDGSNAMEEFDQRGIVDNTVGGRGKVSGASKTNRIDKRWSQWGSGRSLLLSVEIA